MLVCSFSVAAAVGDYYFILSEIIAFESAIRLRSEIPLISCCPFKTAIGILTKGEYNRIM